MHKIFTVKSFFSRMMITYLVIIFVTLSFLGLLLGQLYQNYYYNEREHNLVAQANEINNLFLSYLTQNLSLPRFQDQLNSIDRISGAQIWIVDKQGLVYQASSHGKDNVQGTHLDQEQYQQILQGKTVSSISKNDVYFNTKMMSVAVPLINNGQVLGATIMHIRLDDIQHNLMSVYWLIMIAAMFSILVAFVMIYFMSRRLAEPIKDMTNVSLAMAEGDFTERVDVTSNDEIGQLAATFNYMVSKLGNLEQMRRDFIANVSHELRSPLTSIRGFIQGVIDGTIDDKDKEKYLGIALEETNRLSRLVNDLLELARMESGGIKLDQQPFHLSRVAEKVAAQFERYAAEKDVIINTHVADDLMILADHDRVEEIMINLLDNAIRFSPPKGHIDIKAVKEKNKAMISVSDMGKGIPPEEIENIFDRFYKVDKARTRSKGGTGLGLAIIKQLIRAHGEEIQVQSEVGKGTTFTFTMPIVRKITE